MTVAIRSLAFTCAILLSVALAHAQTTPAKPPADAPATDGFQQLLNGRDLSGWQAQSGKNDTWQVEGGNLVGSGSPRGWLFTDKEYSDFELRLEYKVSERADSGISIRCPLSTGVSADTDPSFLGLEIQIVDDEHTVPSTAGEWLTGSIWGIAAPSQRATRPAGQWNKMTIVARGRRVTVSINGTQVLDANLDDHAAQLTRFPGLKRTAGYVGLQSWAGRVEFRNIAIKSLAPAEAATAPRVDRIETLEKGIYEGATGTMIADPNSAFGQRRVGGQSTKLVKSTDTIPAQKDLVFGFNYKIVGEPKDAPVTIKRILIYPPGGIYNPKTGKTIFKEEADVSKKIGSTGHMDMRFGNAGRVPGTWTFQLWYEDRMMLEETFNVVSP